MADNVNIEVGNTRIPPITPEDNAADDYKLHRANAEEAAKEQRVRELIGEDERPEDQGASPRLVDRKTTFEPTPEDVTKAPAGAVVPEKPDPAPIASDAGASSAGDALSPAGDAPEDIDGLLLSVAKGIFKVGGDIVSGGTEALPQAFGGMIDAYRNATKALEEIFNVGGMRLFDDETGDLVRLLSPEELEESKNRLFDHMSVGDPKSATGGFIRAASQFLTGFLPAARVIKGVTAAKGTAATLGADMSAAAIADAVVFDPTEERLATLLNEIPALAPLVPDYLADVNPDNDARWEERFKLAIEGAGIGAVGDGLLMAFKYYKAQRAAKKLADENTPGAHQEAGRDMAKAATHKKLVQDVQDKDLMPLGDPDGPLIVQGQGDGDTLGTAVTRLKEAATRSETRERYKTALAKLKTIRERFAAKAGAKAKKLGRDPMDDLIDQVRSGPKLKKMPPKPIFNIVKGLGGINPDSSLAAELRARDITAKRFPGLFSRKTGLNELDNIPFADHPIFGDNNRTAIGHYIDREDFIEGLEAEGSGAPWRTAEEQTLIRDTIEPIDMLDEMFSEFDIDVHKMSNKQIKQRLADIEADADRIRDVDAAPKEGGEVRTLDDMDDVPPAVDPGTGQQPAGKPHKIFINTARIKSAEDVKEAIQTIADMDAAAIDKKRRGVVSNKQTIKESDKEYQKIEDLIGRAPGPMTAAQAVAARKLLTASGEQLVGLARKATQPTATKADLYNFRRAMSVHYAIQSEVIAARTETARALQSWVIPAGANKMRSEAIENLLHSNGGAADAIKIATGLVDLGDNPIAVNALVKEHEGGKFKRAFYQMWVNGLLSSPKTHAVNVLSNALTAVWAIPERYLAAGISKAFYNGEVNAGEAGAMAWGLWRGVRDGMMLVAKGSKAGEVGELSDVFDAFGKVENTHGNAISADAFKLDPAGKFGYGIDMLGRFINGPSAALFAEDKFFKTVGYRMHLNAHAYRTALAEGLEGKAMARRMADIMNNPPPDIRADAIDMAAYQTFTNPLGDTGRQMQQFAQKVPGMKFVAPFIRTPTNILKFSFERTPLAPFAGSIRADIKAGGERAAQAYARMTMGSMVMLTFAGMASEGLVTGKSHHDRALGRAERQVRPEYSVKIGDRWYKYNRLDPIGFLVGMAADVAQIAAHVDEDESGKLLMASLYAFSGNMMSKTYMQGVFDFIGAINSNDPTMTPAKWVTKFTGSIMPYSSLVRHTAGTMDPVSRSTKTSAADPDAPQGVPDPVAEYLLELRNNYFRNIPGMSGSLQPNRDRWGKVITRESGIGWGYDFISPMASRVDSKDPLDVMIMENRIKLSPTPRIVSGVRLTAEEWDRFKVLDGEETKKVLDILITQPGFKSLSDGPGGMKAHMIKKKAQDMRKKFAKKMLLMEFNSTLGQRIREKQVRKRELITGQ